MSMMCMRKEEGTPVCRGSYPADARTRHPDWMSAANTGDTVPYVHWREKTEYPILLSCVGDGFVRDQGNT